MNALRRKPQNIFLTVESPSDLLDRGCISRRRFLSRKERKEMEGGNGVREANGITQFTNGEPKLWRRVYPNDASRKPPLDVARLRATFAGTRNNICAGKPA